MPPRQLNSFVLLFWLTELHLFIYTESHNLFNFFSHRLQVLCGRLVSPQCFERGSFSLSFSAVAPPPPTCRVSLSLLSVMLIVASRLRTDVFAGTSWKRALVFRYRCLFQFHFVPQPPRWASKCILSPQLCGSSRFVNIFPLFALRVVLPSFACRRYVSTSFVAVFRLYRLGAVFVLRYVTRKRCILCVATVICVFHPGLNVH